ncbi:MAG: TonB-dependent receptor, partial [Acidobacteria bacterium]|nr:TonB-dependent receptor [Acidobacteriota bacterium]
MKRILTVVALLTLALSRVAFAQVDRATITGTVTDSGGAVIPGATVTITNLATNVTITQPTTETGSYLLVNLIPGKYQVEVELTGFKRVSQVVTLEVGQRARVDARLEVGTLSETVTVGETTQLLNSNDATLGTVIPQFQVSNLPLAIRNWDDLLALVPGVQGDRYTEQGGGTSFGRTGGINVHGARALQNNFLLDGVDNNSISENVQELTTQVSRPSVDAIQEFKVVTSPYAAEYGRSPGAAVSVSTKSGTADQRAGIFTTAIKDPTTGLNFDNNTIPANRIDPYAASIIALVPVPNQPGANNFFRTANLLDNSDRLLIRSDWRPRPKDSIFGRYIYSTRDRDIPGAFGGVIDGTGTFAFGNQTIYTNAFVGGWTRVLSGTMVNEARVSWSRSVSDAVHQAYGL